MAVQSTQPNVNGGDATWLGIGARTGLRVLVMLVDRSGGETASVTTNDPGWTDFVQIGDQVTLPGDSNNRRSVFLFESEVPAGIGSNPIITGSVLDGSSAAVAHCWLAIAIDENDAAGYALVTPRGSADSGTSTTITQGTGSTGSAPAGEVVLVVVEGTRGATTAAWGTATNTPVNPSGGTWDLTVTSGSGNNQRRASMGYVVLTGQSAQTWADTVTYGTARSSSTVIAAFVKSSGGESHSGGSTAPITVTAEGSGRKHASGGSTATVTATVEGAGSSTRSGGSTASVTASADGAGEKHASGGSEATVTAAATGQGTTARSGGSTASITVTAEGGGTAGEQAPSGGSTASVTVTAEGAGISHRLGGSTASVTVIATGAGTTARSGGATAAVTVTAIGGGHAGEPPEIPDVLTLATIRDPLMVDDATEPHALTNLTAPLTLDILED